MVEHRRQRTREQHHLRKNDPEYKAAVLARRRRTYEANKERTRAARYARTADWRQRHVAEIAEAERVWRRANPEKLRLKNERRRAAILNAWVEDVDLGELFVRDDGVCGICQERIDPDLSWPDKFSKTLDHIVPLSRGGEHSWANAQLAHAVCNSRKNNF